MTDSCLADAETPSTSDDVPSVGRARLATAVLFLTDGMTFGTWAALIPAVQRKLDLTPGRLSGVLAGIVVGAMASMPVAGRLIAARGSRAVASAAGVAFPLALVGLAVAPSHAWLVVAAVVFGLCKGPLDVSVNAQAITVESAAGRPIFSSFQACWSAGGLVVAFAVSFALRHGASATQVMLAMAVVLAAAAATSRPHLMVDPPRPGPSVPTSRRRWSLPNARLLELGAVAFLALFSEGVLLDWSAVFAHTVVGVPIATAPVAFAVYALAMAAGRWAGDPLIARVGPANTLRISGGLMVAGMAVAVGLRSWPAVLVGFVLVGFGIANLVPVVFGAAGRAHEHGAGPGVATVSTLGYTGFLTGPPAVGWIAAVAGLPAAFCLVILFGAGIATLGVSVVQEAD